MTMTDSILEDFTMDAYALMKENTCRLCGRIPNVDADIVLAEDGFSYDRKCMLAYIEMTKVDHEDSIISPVTKESIGITLIAPKPIKCLIKKICVGESSDLCGSQGGDGMSEVEEAAKLSDGDLLARKGYGIYFGCSNFTKNESLGFELLVEAASVGGSAYKLGSMYFAGVHGFRVDFKRAKKWLTLAKDRSGSLGPVEVANIESYLMQLHRE